MTGFPTGSPSATTSDMARASTGLNDAHSQSFKRQLKACQSCTTRKIRCDKATPSCSTCTEKGYMCTPHIPLRNYTRRSTNAELSHRPNSAAGDRIACTSCASRKVTCDKALPSCSGCATKGLVCTPRFSTRRRRRGVSELQAPGQSSFSIDPSLSFALPGRGETTEPNYGPLDDQGDVNAIPVSRMDMAYTDGRESSVAQGEDDISQLLAATMNDLSISGREATWAVMQHFGLF